jgi:hypothetical protein
MNQGPQKTDTNGLYERFFCFGVRRSHRIVRRLFGERYKIILGLFSSSLEALRFVKLPYIFRERTRGKARAPLGEGFKVDQPFLPTLRRLPRAHR